MTTFSCDSSFVYSYSVVEDPTPILPALYPTTYIAPSGSTIVVGDGGDFQAALNSATPGDIITLNAGSTYSGHFSLPAKGGTDYIHIRSSAALTTEGTRVTSGQLASFPKILTPDTAATIQAAAGASYYRIINCDIKSGTTAVNGYLIGLGTGAETNATNFPHHIIIDRCGVRGSVTNGGRRGVMFAGSYQAVIDSYLSEWKEVGADTQAIACWTGYGPYKIVNNYLEGAGENVMFGGADTAISGLTPSDIEIRGNYFFKPLTWKADDPSYLGTLWAVKNLLELKHAKRVLITDNEFENCWTQGQSGNGILFTLLNQSGTNPWATVEDITYTYNTLHNVVEGMRLSAHDSNGQVSEQSKRVLIYRNLFYDISSMLFIIGNGYRDLNIDHNTANNVNGNSSSFVSATGAVVQERFRFTNNILSHNRYGLFGDNFGVGNASLNHYFPNAVFLKNAIVMDATYNIDGHVSGEYPVGNFFPNTMADVGFVTLAGNADLRLAPESIYKNAGTDGTDLGANKETPV